MKPSELTRFLSVMIPAYQKVNKHLPVLIKGKPGIGKTDLVFKAASEAGYDMITMHPVVSDPTDVKGLPMAVEDPETGEKKAVWLPFGDLEKLINADKPTVAFLDDLGQAPPVVQAAFMQLLLSRSLNEHKISDHVAFVAATNRKADKAGVSGVLEPVKSRFASIVELEVDHEDWSAWAFGAGVPNELIAFVKMRPDLLHDFQPTSDISNTPSPRTVAYIGKMMQMELPSELEYEAFCGAAGEGFAGEFQAFLRIYRNLPDPDECIKDPQNMKVPSDPSTKHALAAALAFRAKDSNMAKIVECADRFPDEFGVMMMKSATQRDSNLKKTKPFLDWVRHHKDVLV